MSNRTIEMPLTKGYTAIIDEIDADLAELKWQANVGTSGLVYASHRRYFKGSKPYRFQKLYLHQVIAERLGLIVPVGGHIDHKDGNGLNNRRSNIRVATPSQNQCNSKLRATNTSGYKGVSWSKAKGAWIARIQISHKPKHLGYFNTAEEAYQAYCKAAQEYYGEYARLE